MGWAPRDPTSFSARLRRLRASPHLADPVNALMAGSQERLATRRMEKNP
jgi:hypothetical protein